MHAEWQGEFNTGRYSVSEMARLELDLLNLIDEVVKLKGWLNIADSGPECSVMDSLQHSEVRRSYFEQRTCEVGACFESQGIKRPCPSYLGRIVDQDDRILGTMAATDARRAGLRAVQSRYAELRDLLLSRCSKARDTA
jgi:hypothetical protein